jgi:F-type H+-transporting ATPase subunit gamma
MIPAVKLKQNLRFNQDLDELVEVMKLAATLQFNQFRSRPEPSLKTPPLLEAVFGQITQEQKDHPLLRPKNDLPIALVLVSSDEGFLGELNSLLAGRVLEARRSQDIIMACGRQGADYLRELSVNFSPFMAATDKLDFKEIEPLRDHIFGLYAKGEVGGVRVVYARFVNLSLQQIESEQLLPLAIPVYQPDQAKEILIEPDSRAVILGWIKLWLGFKLYQIFWSAKLAELSARIMHLESSSQELTRISQHLKLEYFKHLHNLSDKTIREISASRLMRRH